ncbi:MAG: histidinol-phosphate transaminase [Oceanospirillales bacterium LUC14_002_19_P2]|nr:MAG: histidinol-phosphate transaminase [Oceanospirillales bacterium LUC14_002_19_P2]
MGCDYIALANPGVQGLQPYQPGKPVSEVARELGLEESAIVKLASNENPLGPSQKAVDAMARAVGDLARYPDGNGFALKAALSAKYGVAAECFTLGNGSNDVLELVARAYVAPGDEVIFSEHAFAVYPIVTLGVGGVPVVAPAQDWGHDLTAMADRISDKTRVIFIANPNNPTGTWLKRDALQPFLDSVPEHIIVVLDEAYCEYVDEAEYPNGLLWLEHYPNLVVTRTFSKLYGLAGLRIGYAVAGASITNVLNRIRQPFNVNSVAMEGALAVLEDDAYLARSRQVNTDGLRQLEVGLTGLGLSWIPSIGNFVTFDTGGDANGIFDRLLQRGVIVRPIAAYGMPSHLRVSVGTEAENQQFLDALKAVLKEIADGG